MIFFSNGVRNFPSAKPISNPSLLASASGLGSRGDLAAERAARNGKIILREGLDGKKDSKRSTFPTAEI